MITGSVKWRSNLYWLFSILFLTQCSSTSENITPKSHTVEIKQMKFEPAELLVQKGDTVIWINHDLVVHDVTEDPGQSWSSSRIPNGQSWSMVITKSTDYFCNIHQVMKGKVIVK
jgi:plastocyanin